MFYNVDLEVNSFFNRLQLYAMKVSIIIAISVKNKLKVIMLYKIFVYELACAKFARFKFRNLLLLPANLIGLITSMHINS